MGIEKYRVLYKGFDTLHIVHRGLIDFVWWKEAELKEKKKIAQEKREVPYVMINWEPWEVSERGTKEYVYCLMRNGWRIYLLNTRGFRPNLIQAKVEIPSSRLRMGIEDLPSDATSPLLGVGINGEWGIQRMDIAVDVEGFAMSHLWGLTPYGYPRKMRTIDSEASITGHFSLGNQVRGETVMIGTNPLLRIYDKKKLSIKQDSDWFVSWYGKEYSEILAEHEGDPKKIPDITRFEFQLRGQVLKELKVYAMDNLIEKLPGVWEYLTGQWMALKVDDPKRKSKRKLPNAPIWEFIRSVDFGEGLPLKRERPISHDSLKNLKQIQGHLSSFFVKEDLFVEGKNEEEWEEGILNIFKNKILRSKYWKWDEFLMRWNQKYNQLRGV